MPVIRVVPRGEEWVTRDEKGAVRSVNASQPEAFLEAWREAAREDVPLVDHRENGQFRKWHRPG